MNRSFSTKSNLTNQTKIKKNKSFDKCEITEKLIVILQRSLLKPFTLIIIALARVKQHGAQFP